MSESQLPIPAARNPHAIRELERFFALATEMNRSLTMFSGYIDDVWHSLMQDEKAYNDFCNNVVGRYVKHIPSGQNNPIVDIEWLRQYEFKYGPLPADWFADETGTIDLDLLTAYRKTGEIRASWKCTPA